MKKILILISIISLKTTQITTEGATTKEAITLPKFSLPKSPYEIFTYLHTKKCPTKDCICEAFKQGTCKTLYRSADHNVLWSSTSLHRNTDFKILKGRVIAYKLRWFNGSWSGWYVPGYNDMDMKKNVAANTLRRKWSYFQDHQHQVVICY